MVGRMGGGLNVLVEIELKMAKIPPFTYLNITLVSGQFLSGLLDAKFKLVPK